MCEMKFKTQREGDFQEATKIDIYVDGSMYRITETVDGKLEIHKSYGHLKDRMSIFPRCSNAVEIK